MWSSHATKRPVPYTGLHARQKRRAALVHTNGGDTDHGSLYGWWCQHANGSQGDGNRHIGAHFQVMLNGHAEQYVDTDLVVYHAYSASEWAVGFEVEDSGDPSKPMTAAQLTTIEVILRELGVPGRQLTSDQPGDGIGWHDLFVSWNKSAHRCPGPVREAQVRKSIIPALAQKPPQPNVAPLYVYKRTLRLGMVGTDVTALKKRLKYLGYSSVPGPYFGRGLKASVERFQRHAGIVIDGIVGPQTAMAINHKGI